MELLQSMFPMKSEWIELEKKELPWNSTSSLSLVTIAGQPESIRASLLFQSSVSHTADGSHVTYITKRPFNKLPLQIHGMPSPQPTLMKTMKMMYMNNFADLMSYLTELHKQALLPGILAVENLDQYVEHIQGEVERLHTLAKLYALLTDVSHYLTSQNPSISRVYVTSCHSNQQHLQLAKKFSQVFLLTASSGKDVYQITPCDVNASRKWCLKFHAFADCLKLIELLE